MIKSFKNFPLQIIIVTVIIMTAVILLLPTYTYASSTDDGILYELSEDESYVILTGYSYLDISFTIPSEIDGLPVKEIAAFAFASNTTLTSIIIPDSVTVIGEGAFKNCTNLVSVTLPEGLTELPYECFSYCSMLKKIILPESLISIDDYCFENCSMLGKLRIPPYVTNIGYDAFVHCESIYLVVDENEYAAQYALDFNINTQWQGTSGYFWTVIGISTLAVIIVAAIILSIYYAYLRSHPEKNPNLVVYKVIGKVYNKLAFFFKLIFGTIIKYLTLLITAIIWLIEQAYKLIRYRKTPRNKHKNEASSDTDEIQ